MSLLSHCLSKSSWYTGRMSDPSCYYVLCVFVLNLPEMQSLNDEADSLDI